MKIVKIFTMRKIILLFCISFLGCTNNEPYKSKDQTIREIENLNITPLINLKASVRSRDRGDDRIIVTNYYVENKGAVLLKIDENCNLFEIDYYNWNKTSKLSLATTNLITKCLCEIGLNAISVDSCGNTYFSVSQVENYEYVIVKNKLCLDNRFIYSQYYNKCYRVK
jgi:hypothetical protein